MKGSGWTRRVAIRSWRIWNASLSCILWGIHRLGAVVVREGRVDVGIFKVCGCGLDKSGSGGVFVTSPLFRWYESWPWLESCHRRLYRSETLIKGSVVSID